MNIRQMTISSRLYAFVALAIAGLITIAVYGAPEGSVKLEGSFTNQGATYPITALFVPSTNGTWDTTWKFTFGKRGPQVFKGTATGTLGEGALSGQVKERRLFVFSGEWKDGHFSGTTAEYFKPKGDPSPTGTIELTITKEE